MKCGAEGNVFVGTMLVDVYVKCGSLVDGRRGVRSKSKRVNWLCSYMHACNRECVKPDGLTYAAAALKAYCTLAALEKGRELHTQILKVGHEPIDLAVANNLIDMYSKCGSMVEAQKVFDMCPARDVVTWNTLIARCDLEHVDCRILSPWCKFRATGMVFDLFARMQEVGIQSRIEIKHKSLENRRKELVDSLSRKTSHLYVRGMRSPHPTASA